MTKSVYQLRSLVAVAQELKEALEGAIEHCMEEGRANDVPSSNLIFEVQEKLRDFEAVLRSEFVSANLYQLMQKSAFDTNTLVEAGELAFPHDVRTFVPEAIPDLREAMRCIAFELPTAAAFHLHRGNELVLRRYWDAVSEGADRPRNNNLGTYISELEKIELAEATVISALRDIKNLHRNPTIHDDQPLDNVEEAINLQGAIRAAIGAMLLAIPLVDINQPLGTHPTI